MVLKQLTCTAGILIATATATQAGPFGINQGDKVETLKVTETKDNFRFSLETVPHPHPSFMTYYVEATAETGVCSITAVSDFFDNDAFGTRVRREYENVKNQLEAIYKKGASIDQLAAGALWSRPQDWVMSIAQNERTFFTLWSKDIKNTKVSLKDNISGIILQVVASGRDKSLLTLNYEFENHNQCKAIHDKEQGGAL